MKSFLFCVLLSIVLFGCYTRRKATKQVNLAAVTYPDIMAKKARDLFPCVTKGGDTIWVSDSAEYRAILKELQDENIFMNAQHDTLLKRIYDLQKDTACYEIVELYVDIIGKMKSDYAKLEEKFKHIPPITITKIIHDTTVDNAAVKACEIDKNTAISLLDKKTTESDGWHSKAKKRYYIMWGLILLIALVSGWKVYNAFKPKLKSA